MKGWIRYFICDSSGSGYDRPNYLYLEWATPAKEDDVRAHILDYHEDWANHAKSYSFRVEFDVMPPADEVRKYLHTCRSKADAYRKLADVLSDQLRQIEGNGPLDHL